MKNKGEYDIAIVGAGPAGSSAAIRLAQNGLRVVLVEQKRFPREKLCGEFISPECLAHFAELNILDEMTFSGGVAIGRTVFYARNGRSVAVPSEWFGSGANALGLSRAKMDDLLIKRARTAGAEVFEETSAVGPVLENGRVFGVRIRDAARQIYKIRARLTIDATGRARILARQIENTDKRKRAAFVAFKTHLTAAAVPDGDCEIYAYRGGYGGCNRVEDGKFNLCFIVAAALAKEHGGDARRIIREVVFANEHARESLENARIDGDWFAVPIETYGRAALAPADGLLTVGDAAAFIDPFTGSGILLALEGARIAADVITAQLSVERSQYSFAALEREYGRKYDSAFNKRLRFCSLLRHAAFVPFLAESVIKGLAQSKWLTRRFAVATRQS